MSEYIGRLQKKLDRRVDGMTLRDVIIDVPCLAEGATRHGSIEHFVMSWLQSEQDKTLISLVGDYGQGKTTTLISAAHQLLTSDPHVEPIPLYMELRPECVGLRPRDFSTLASPSPLRSPDCVRQRPCEPGRLRLPFS
jgi:hypothetical protein